MTKGKVGKLTILAAAMGVVAICASIPTNAMAGSELTRLSAQNTAIDGKAILLPSGVDPGDAGAITIYSNTVKVSKGDNTLYVTVSGTALGSCDGVSIDCTVDGTECLNGNGEPGFPHNSVGVPNGWVDAAGGDFFDGSFGLTGMGYQFCAPVTKGSHTIKLHAATQIGDCNTYIEALSVYVDENRIDKAADACGTYATPNPANSPD